MDNTGTIAAAVLIILCTMVFLGLVWPGAGRKPETVNVPEPRPLNEADTELAHRVWTAHVANQHLDQVLMTGTPDDILRAEQVAARANSKLVSYLSEKAER